MTAYEEKITSLKGNELKNFLNEAIKFIDTTTDRFYTTDELIATGYFECKDELYCYYIEVAQDVFATPEFLYEHIPFIMELLDDIDYCNNFYRIY